MFSAAEFCRKMKDEKLCMLNEASKLSDEIAALQTDIRSVFYRFILCFLLRSLFLFFSGSCSKVAYVGIMAYFLRTYTVVDFKIFYSSMYVVIQVCVFF